MVNKRTYKQIKAELDEVIACFEAETIDIDEATTKYKKAQKLVKELQEYLAHAKNEVTSL